MKDSRRNRKKIRLTGDDWVIVCIAMLLTGPAGGIIAWFILRAVREIDQN